MSETQILFIAFILIVVLGLILLRKRVISAINAYKNDIAKDVENSEKLKLEAVNLLDEMRKKEESISSDMQERIDSAKIASISQIEQSKRAIHEEVNTKLSSAKEDIEKAKENFIKDMQERVTEDVLSAIEEYIGENVDVLNEMTQSDIENAALELEKKKTIH